MSVTWAVRQPHPVVRPLVTRYVGYAQHDVTLPLHRGLPSRHVTLVISLAGPVRSGWPGTPCRHWSAGSTRARC